MNRSDRDRAAEEAANFVKGQFPTIPRFALILGTGANQLADTVSSTVVIDYREIPHFPRSTALGHRGRLVCGHLANQPIVVMQGRFHLYEGYPREQVALPIEMLARLGTEFLFVGNAAGGLNPTMSTGDVMLIDSHIDLMFRGPQVVAPGRVGPTCRATGPYDPLLLSAGLACGRRHGFAVHRGVYAAMLGPTYETRAEYRMLRRIGADVAGMSTVPEVNAANRHGIRVLGLSLVTNVASPDALQPTSGQEVIEAARSGAPKLEAIVLDAIRQNS
ncbi:MAG: purine-nucleoside phosphorylase [Planctomycetota bacterium]|nr:purine-nucleoside phosphorylase [Planctomycetota bacterium]